MAFVLAPWSDAGQEVLTPDYYWLIGAFGCAIDDWVNSAPIRVSRADLSMIYDRALANLWLF